MNKRLINLITTAFLLVLIACGGGGGGSGNDAPVEAEITTSVTAITWSFLEAAPLSCENVDSFYIVVKDKGTDIPLRDVNVTISNPLAVPNNTAIQLYDGNPTDGGSKETSPMTLTTDKNGTITLYFKYCGGGGVAYKGDFLVSSGPLFETVTFEVTAD
jgi:hypothetical protein